MYTFHPAAHRMSTLDRTVSFGNYSYTNNLEKQTNKHQTAQSSNSTIILNAYRDVKLHDVPSVWDDAKTLVCYQPLRFVPSFASYLIYLMIYKVC
mmetsp:Transcript_10739/g.16045  ORF Transcript_10739/g.16045 Transcript_10739/m.16045 type:complete len:95 (+) Transcript_10739:138-422(+)